MMLATETDCAHHWIIDIANGPLSNAACKFCGLTDAFENHINEIVWANKKTRSKVYKAVTEMREGSK